MNINEKTIGIVTPSNLYTLHHPGGGGYPPRQRTSKYFLRYTLTV